MKDDGIPAPAPGGLGNPGQLDPALALDAAGTPDPLGPPLPVDPQAERWMQTRELLTAQQWMMVAAVVAVLVGLALFYWFAVRPLLRMRRRARKVGVSLSL